MARIAPRQRRESFPHPGDSDISVFVGAYCTIPPFWIQGGARKRFKKIKTNKNENKLRVNIWNTRRFHGGAVQSFGLESVNVVGYSNKALQSGYTMTGACFVDVTEGDSIDLTSIKVAGYTGESMEDVVIQTLDSFGNAIATYSWIDDDGAGDFDPGLYDEGYEAVEPGTVFIDAGTALWTAGLDELHLTYAGQVLAAASVIPLQAGYTAVANPNAVAVDLTDVLVTGYTGESMEDVVVQTLDSFGNAVATYSWIDDNGGGDFDPGWYDEGYEAIQEDTVFFQPGDGLWVAGLDGLNLVFPATAL